MLKIYYRNGSVVRCWGNRLRSFFHISQIIYLEESGKRLHITQPAKSTN